MDTSIRLNDKLTLKNPVLNASGTFAYGEEFAQLYDLSVLGGVLVKGLSLMPKEGNPVPRIAEATGGLINAIGLENIGTDAFIEDKLPFLVSQDVPVFVNFFGNTEEEYVACARRLSVSGVDALEMNVSCPNVKQGGIQFGTDPRTLSSLVRGVRAVTDKPLFVKLSPLVTDIRAMALAAEDAGADGLTCINTVPAMAIDAERQRPVLGNVTGGLSGPAIKPIALKMVWEVCQVVHIPVIASGGVCDGADVMEFILAGAHAVEVGSASLRDPYVFPRIVREVDDYLERHGVKNLADLRGALRI